MTSEHLVADADRPALVGESVSGDVVAATPNAVRNQKLMPPSHVVSVDSVARTSLGHQRR